MNKRGETTLIWLVLGVLAVSLISFLSNTYTGMAVGGVGSINANSNQKLKNISLTIETDNNKLELRESFGNVMPVVEGFMWDPLKGGTISTSFGVTTYRQYLRFKSDSLNINNPPFVDFTENDEPVEKVGDFMVVNVGGTNATDAFFEYELQFEEGLKSTISSAKLKGLDDESLVILGRTYVFVDTSINTSANEVKLVLLGGAVYDVLEEGEKKTYTLKEKTYDVQVVLITDQNPETVVFRVNGEQTSELDDGEVEILSDGTLLGVSEIVSNEAGEAGGGDIVEFYIGANKLELEDKEYVDSNFESRVKIDNEPLEDSWVEIDVNELSSTEVEVTSIKYRLVADSLPGLTNLYIPPGHGVREFLDEPQGMLGQNWDLRYEGLDDTGVSVIKLDPQGDDEYRLEFTNQLGQLYRIPYITNKGGVFKFGDDDDDLVFGEGYINTSSSANATLQFFNIDPNDYFVLSKQDSATGFDETATSHVVRYTNIDTSNNQITVDDLATETREFTYSTTSLANGTLGSVNLLFGGNTFRAYISNNASTGYALVVDQNGDGIVGNASYVGDGFALTNGWNNRTRLQEVRITARGGAVIDLGNHSRSHGVNITNGAGTNAQIQGGTRIDATGSNLTLVTVNSEFDENGPLNNGGDEIIIFEIQTRTNNELGIPKSNVKLVTNGTTAREDLLDKAKQSFTLNEPDDNGDHHLGMSSYGVKVDLYEPSGTTEAETIFIRYPSKQVTAIAYLNFVAPLPDICEDTDGGKNFSKKGEVKYFEDEIESTFIDNCRYQAIDPNSKVLDEGYCDDNRFRIESFECIFGCSNGACISAPAPTCTDSDGIDPFTSGNISGRNETGYYYFSDVCPLSHQLHEMTCYASGQPGVVSPFGCVYGCSDGACNQDVRYCIDSDGNSTNTKGAISGTGWIFYNNTVFNYTRIDRCMENYVIENICVNNSLDPHYFSTLCPNGCLNGKCMPAPTCTDTDPNNDVYIKGEVRASGVGYGYHIADVCSGSKKVKERYCGANKKPRDLIKTCPNNKKCIQAKGICQK